MLFVVSASTLVAQSVALTGAARWADSVRVTAERASISGDTAALSAAGALADRALSAFPNDPLLMHYRAYVLYREVLRDPARSSAAGKARVERAVDLLQRSAAVRPMPESDILRSSLLGMLAGGGMVAGMRYGPASSSAREDAMTAAPDNPRVLMIAASGLWFTPKMWGGGEDKGYAMIQRAIAMFAHDSVAPPLPSWGAAEAYAWLGQMERKRGNIPAAKAAYQKALSLEPQYAWVSRALLPDVEGPSR